MYCIKCGKELIDNSNYCSNCGELVHKQVMKCKDLSNQKVSANLWRGSESVGGHIYFYSDQMIFKSHALNIQRGDTAIHYKEITKIEFVSTLGIVPNGLKIYVNTNESYQFVLWKREEISEFLNFKRIE